MTMGAGAALLGLGLAVALGAARTPLTGSSTAAPKAADLSPVMIVRASGVTLSGAASLSMTQAQVSQAQPVPVGIIATVSMKPTNAPKRPATAKSQVPASPSPQPSQSASPSVPTLTPQPIPENQTPTGQNQLAWSEAILTALHAPLTDANIISMGYWMQNEAGSPPYGMVGENNPINVSEPGYGGTPIESEGGGYSLMSYPTVQDGIDAIVAYLTVGAYNGIVDDLRNGVGLNDSSLASEISEYSGGGYTTIPDSWGQSQGQPETPS